MLAALGGKHAFELLPDPLDKYLNLLAADCKPLAVIHDGAYDGWLQTAGLCKQLAANSWLQQRPIRDPIRGPASKICTSEYLIF